MQAIGRQPQRALDGAPVHCERHSPEQITLYRLVQQQAASFIAHTEPAPAVNCRDTSRMRSTPHSSLVPQVPRRFRRLMDGMVLRVGGHDWRCIADYGYAPERIALHAPVLNMLISGDMVPPRLSTNVGVIDIELEADLLPLYLASIDRMRALPAGTLVLPSHGKPFGWLHERIAQLAAHHEERFANVPAACAEGPKSAADLLGVLFRRKPDLHQTTFETEESVTHLRAPMPGAPVCAHANRLRRALEACW